MTASAATASPDRAAATAVPRSAAKKYQITQATPDAPLAMTSQSSAVMSLFLRRGVRLRRERYQWGSNVAPAGQIPHPGIGRVVHPPGVCNPPRVDEIWRRRVRRPGPLPSSPHTGEA